MLIKWLKKHKKKTIALLLLTIVCIIYSNPKYETGNQFYNAVLNWPYMKVNAYPNLTELFKKEFPEVKTITPEISTAMVRYKFVINHKLTTSQNEWSGETLTFQSKCRCILPDCLPFETCILRVFFNLSDNGEIDNINAAVGYRTI